MKYIHINVSKSALLTLNKLAISFDFNSFICCRLKLCISVVSLPIHTSAAVSSSLDRYETISLGSWKSLNFKTLTLLIPTLIYDFSEIELHLSEARIYNK